MWIDGGLHATEAAGSQQLLEMAYQMLSRNDAETLRLLNEDILLCVPANPDGQELVANWYMREKDENIRTMKGCRAYTTNTLATTTIAIRSLPTCWKRPT